MDRLEIQAKIAQLIETRQGHNTYIALQLMQSQLNYTYVQALKALGPVEEPRNYPHPNDFYACIRIADIWVEYEYLSGYIPYMEANVTASRIVYRALSEEQLEPLDGLSTFLPIGDDETVEEVWAVIRADYLELIPELMTLLGLEA